MTMSPESPVRLLAPIAVRAQIAELAGRFKEARGLAVETAFALNPEVPRQILAGAAFDVAITNPGYVDELIACGRVDSASHVPFGRVPLAAARRGRGSAAVLSTAAEVTELLRQAGTIAYTGEGTSGRTFLAVLGRLGLGEAFAARTLPMAAGQSVRAAAAGEVDLAVAPLSTVLAAPGVGAVAIFPPELGANIDMSMFAAAAAADSGGPRALLRFLADPANDGYLASKGVVRFRFD